MSRYESIEVKRSMKLWDDIDKDKYNEPTLHAKVHIENEKTV